MSTNATIPLLDSIRIASPCTADWNAMVGDDRQRFCQQCQLHVHDLGAMTAAEAEAFLRGSSGRVCARFRRRADGRILTRDCPVGLRARLRGAWLRAAALASALLALVGCKGSRGEGCGPNPPAPGTVEVPLMGDVVGPELQGEVEPNPEIMGRIALPQPPDRR